MTHHLLFDLYHCPRRVPAPWLRATPRGGSEDMHPFRLACRRALAEIDREGRYRVFTPLRKDANRFPVFTMLRDGVARDVTVWSSNDYLGMGVHPAVTEAAAQAARRMGAGAGGTRNIAGTSHLHDALEAELANLHGKRGGAAVHVRLRGEPGVAVHDPAQPAGLVGVFGREEPRLDDRRAEGRAGQGDDLRPQRPGRPGGKACRRAAGGAEADRVRERLFDGRRHLRHRRDLRPGGAIRRHDLPRRGGTRSACTARTAAASPSGMASPGGSMSSRARWRRGSAATAATSPAMPRWWISSARPPRA